MRYLIFLIFVLAWVGMLQGQPAPKSSADYENSRSPISLLSVEGKLINPAPPAPPAIQDPVVYVGYGHVSEKFLTGSAVTISPGNSNLSGYTNIQEFLKGRVPGLQVTRTGMNSYRMQIRGPNSLMLSTEPLLVVDGIPMGTTRNLNALNPHEITSITVLKGPEAAIYGSRGANGVIVVKTK